MALEINEINVDSISATTIFSGSSNLEVIINNIVAGARLPQKISPQIGVNTYTGGTSTLPTINLSSATINNLSVSGNTSLGVFSSNTIFSSSTNLYSLFKTSAGLSVPIHGGILTSPALTSQVLAEQFFGNNTTGIRKLDLSTYTRCRIVATVTTSSASANTPRLLLKGKTDAYSATVGDYITLGVSGSEVSISLASAANKQRDSGWVALNATARTDNVFVAVTQIGGDGVASPVIGHVMIYFE